MTSPVRKRRDESRRRLAAAEASEIVQQARGLQCVQQAHQRGNGAACEPMSRSEAVLISRAVRGRWDIPEPKRLEIIHRLTVAIDAPDDRIAISAARALVAMEAANLRDQQGGDR